MGPHMTAHYQEIERTTVPVWMCCTENLSTKAHASTIVAFEGTHMIDSLGRRRVSMCNNSTACVPT